MLGQFLKAYLPRSLYGRAALILLVAVLTILAGVSFVFFHRVCEDVTRLMTLGVAEVVGVVRARVESG